MTEIRDRDEYMSPGSYTVVKDYDGKAELIKMTEDGQQVLVVPSPGSPEYYFLPGNASEANNAIITHIIDKEGYLEKGYTKTVGLRVFSGNLNTAADHYRADNEHARVKRSPSCQSRSHRSPHGKPPER
jgi:hypothetical protein